MKCIWSVGSLPHSRDMADLLSSLHFCPRWVPHLLKRISFWQPGYLLFVLSSMVFLGEVWWLCWWAQEWFLRRGLLPQQWHGFWWVEWGREKNLGPPHHHTLQIFRKSHPIILVNISSTWGCCKILTAFAGSLLLKPLVILVGEVLRRWDGWHNFLM